MKLSELKQIVDYHYRDGRLEDPDVLLQIKLPYSTVGSTPVVKITSARMGFDWDSGKFILVTEEPVTPSDLEFARQMREMQDRAGWADYENRNLKAEIRRLKKQLGVKE